MKTKIFLIVCLFTGIGFSQVYAQKGNSETSKTDQGWTESFYWAPVYSNGQYIDYLGGSVRVHFVAHFKDGSPKFENDQIKGELTSGYTGEIFELKEVDRYNFFDGLSFIWKFNLIGDLGTHYIGTFTYNFLKQELVITEGAVGPR